MQNFSDVFPRRLPLGKVVITQAASRAIQHIKPEAISLLVRHHLADWGDVSERDALQNEIALLLGLRISSRYRLSSGQILWIISEANRSITKISLASEESRC